MKKTWILAVLGLSSVGVISSYGQGHLNFTDYANSTSPTINYAASNVPVGKAGLSLGGSFAAELAWGNGANDTAGSLTLIPGTITYFGYDGPGANGDADGASGPSAAGAGWFQLNTTTTLTTAMGYTGGQVTLEVFAFNNGSLGAATVFGNSTLFNFTPATGSSPTPSTAPDISPFTVAQAVPEPTTLALAGLGGAALLAFRRKKA
jgi:hypothetical protein